ncbi:MAG: hypothetical protein ACFB9M_16100 [Myxococcota bacterium]
MGVWARSRPEISALCLSLGLGCAHAPDQPSAEPSPAPISEAAASASDSDLDSREAREEVLRAEEARQRAKFHNRMAKLRAAEEARFKERAKQAPSEPQPANVLEFAQELKALTAESSLSSSALPPPPVSSPAPGPALANSSAANSPTPEELLRGADCLLRDHARRAEQQLQSRRGQSDARKARGEWALLLVEVQQLKRDIDAEIAHRRLGADGGCPSPTPAQQLLATLVGSGGRTGTPEATLSGIVRLRAELERRAGLPRAPER